MNWRNFDTFSTQLGKWNFSTERGKVNRHIKIVNKMICFFNEEILYKMIVNTRKEKTKGTGRVNRV